MRTLYEIIGDALLAEVWQMDTPEERERHIETTLREMPGDELLRRISDGIETMKEERK